MKNIKDFYDWIDLLCNASMQDLNEIKISPKKEEGILNFPEHDDMHPTVKYMLNKDRKFPLETVEIKNFEQKNDVSIDAPIIHYGPASNEFTRSHHALALVVGTDIFFRNGAYKPETEEGRKIIAHELTHVAQNKEEAFVDHRTKEELEEEAKEIENNDNSDQIITLKIMGISFKIRQSKKEKIIKMIKAELEKQIEEYCIIHNDKSTQKLHNSYKKAKATGDIDNWLR